MEKEYVRLSSKINIIVNKTKFMVFNRQEHAEASLHLNNQRIEEVNKQFYGTNMTSIEKWDRG